MFNLLVKSKPISLAEVNNKAGACHLIELNLHLQIDLIA